MANRILRHDNQRARNLVFMGMGEPFHNERNVARALNVFHEREGLGMSQRRTLVSTIGAMGPMLRHAERFRRSPLALSLHSALPEKRAQLIPAARNTPFDALIDTLWRVAEIQRQPVMIEHILLAGVNDGDPDMRALVALAKDRPALINLIPYNAIPDAPDLAPLSRPATRLFAERLRAEGLTVTVRNSLGGDVAAACGQLARRG